MKERIILKNKKILIINMSIIIILCLLFLYVFQCENKAFAQEINEIYYCDDYSLLNSASALSSSITEEIHYVKKVEEKYLINDSFPNYYNTNNSLSNACANVAGANLIGYFDRYYENLIPNHSPGVQRPSGYIYQSMTINTMLKQGVIDALYDKMKTNTISSGTSQTQYKSGLASYIKEKGYNIDIVKTMNGFNLDLEKVNSQLRSGNPISLYLQGYNFSSVKDSGSGVTIYKSNYEGNHILIVYGYEKILYYDGNNNLVSTKIYLYTAPGIKSMPNIYILDESGLVDAEAMRIY